MHLQQNDFTFYKQMIISAADEANICATNKAYFYYMSFLKATKDNLIYVFLNG